MLVTNQSLPFDDLGSRQVQADFSGGHLSSDGGVLLLRQVDQGLGLSRALAQCFDDTRQQVFVDHSVEELLGQRLHALALGYADLNDHDVDVVLVGNGAGFAGLYRSRPAEAHARGRHAAGECAGALAR